MAYTIQNLKASYDHNDQEANYQAWYPYKREKLCIVYK